MFGSEILDVAIGVVLLFLFISLICTAAMEGTEALLKFRAKDLERGIRELLADPVKASTVLKDFYEHPLIFPLYAGKYDPDRPGKLPSYIPAANFVGAILDLSGKGKLGTSNIADTIRCALGLNENDLEAAKTQLQTWYDGTMDRVSGWYKRRTQGILFVIGLAIAVALNIDAITVARELSANNALREAALTQAEQILAEAPPPEQEASSPSGEQPVASPGQSPSAAASADPAADSVATTTNTAQAGDQPAPVPGKVAAEAPAAAPDRDGPGTSQVDPRLTALANASYKQLQERLEGVGYPIGWSPAPQAITCQPNTNESPFLCVGSGTEGTHIPSVLLVGLGWLSTALAVMLGAPFWFDVLNKFMVIRSTVKPREKSREEASEDRQNRAAGRLDLVVRQQPASGT